MYKDVETVPVLGSDGKIYNRMPCETWGRVMGYLRPVSGYNFGKKSERYSRTFFTEDKVNNSKFIRQYS